MKHPTKKALTLLSLFIISLVLPLQAPLTHAQTTLSAKDRALQFIEDVIQPDMSKYNVTLVNDIVGQPLIWPIETQESVTYYLADIDANGMGPDINCLFINNSLTMVQLGVDQAFVHSPNADESSMLVYSNQSTNLTAQTVGFLERYENFTGENLRDMISAITNVDVTQNVTKILGDVKLTTENTPLETDISLKYTYNGTDYTGISLTFRNGQFYILGDDRSEWTIGNTDVNITQTQAISIAQQYMKTYSYTLDDGTVVNQFNVTSINAGLNTYPRDNTTTIYPYWSVQLNLNDTFPPACYAISLGIWADSGTVFLAQPLFVGGGLPPPAATPTATTPQQTQSQTQTGIPLMELSIAAAVAIVAIVAVVLVLRKSKKGKSSLGNRLQDLNCSSGLKD